MGAVICQALPLKKPRDYFGEDVSESEQLMSLDQSGRK